MNKELMRYTAIQNIKVLGNIYLVLSRVLLCSSLSFLIGNNLSFECKYRFYFRVYICENHWLIN